MVLRRGQHHDALAVAEREHARLLALEEVLDDDGGAGRPEGAAEAVANEVRCLLHILRDDHALAGGQPVGLDHQRRAVLRTWATGSPDKVEWLRSLGIEAFDYRETQAKDALADGIDVYFDNVGGSHLEAALFALRPFGRVIACGSISRYNDERPEPGPRNLALIVTKRLR